MTRTIFLLSVLLLVVGCGSDDPVEPEFRDVTLEIPLDGLTGDYAHAGLEEGIPNQRAQTVRFPGEVGTFREMRIVVDGGWDQQGSWEQVRIVGGIAYRDTIPFPARFDVILTHPELGETGIRATFHPLTDPMGNWWRAFTVCCPSRDFAAEDLARLTGREVTVQIVLPAVPAPEQVVLDPRGTLDRVKLVLETTVPVGGTPLGGNRALFR